MIAFLRGKLARSLPNLLWLDVNGVGYAVQVPMGSFDGVPEGGAIEVLTHLVVREDAQMLFGFRTEEEREVFLLLIERVSGIGPKMAMAVLGGMAVDAFKAAVVGNDLASLSKIKGVGRKTAERIVLELKDKVGVTEVWKQATTARGNPVEVAANDAILALLTLGYKQAEALQAVRATIKVMQEAGEETGTDALVRGALRTLN